MLKPLVAACSISAILTVAATAQTPAGGEFRVNTYTTNRQSEARVGVDADGDFVVTWRSNGPDGSGYAIVAQRYAATGTSRGAEFVVNVHTTGSQGSPEISVGPKGDFVVAWSSVYQDGSALSVHARRFDAAGNSLGGEFQVNTFTTGIQYLPRIGRAADGSFVVSWTSVLIDGSSSAVVARRFDASGSPIGGEFVANTYTTGYQLAGGVAVEPNGNFVVVWEDFNGGRDGDASAIFGQRFDAAANRLGSEFLVNTYTTGAQKFPSVSMSPTGGFVVAWSSSTGDGSGYAAFARRFDGAGNPIGSDFVVNTYTTLHQYGYFGMVAHDARGNFIITWVSGPAQDGDDYGIFGQRFSASGARRGAEFRVNTYTTNRQAGNWVASDPVGNFVVTWDSLDQDGDARGVFSQRFGGLQPAALGVDGTPGNFVLEPGETVDVRPSWRNINGAAQSFGGALTDITGPAGATYAITDATGDYGTVANGATASCADCYAISVSDPSVRPVLHWDASAVESILPDTQGQQKQWLLHVGDSFSDVPQANPFYRFVETLLHHGVTTGCNISTAEYCPTSPATREQMALFVLVAKEGLAYVPPSCTTPMFADVQPSSAFCRWIEELARRGVVAGCGGGNYCPFLAVTREQMPVFVLRTLDPTLQPPACATPIYDDVPASSGFCRWIEELTRRGVVTGCGGGNYCPTAAVTREQMGVFISVTFGLALYGP